MKLATRDNGTPDGELLLVSGDLRRCVPARAAHTLQDALERWTAVEPALAAQYRELEAGREAAAVRVDPARLLAALPRCYQFLDGSAFLAHNHILAEAWGFERRQPSDAPLMYQGLCDRFYPAHGAVAFRSEQDDIDFEAEFAVITDGVPLGTPREAAAAHIRLVVLLNDWSLRAFGPSEMKSGFGFIQAKPHSALSAFAVTPAGLGSAWKDSRVCLAMQTSRNEQRFGTPGGWEMSYGFDQLVAHAAATRDLCAGTIIGSGTVSSHEYARVGSGCIAEQRAIDRLAGRPLTPYLRFGERVRLEAVDGQGHTVLGAIDQQVTQRQQVNQRT